MKPITQTRTPKIPAMVKTNARRAASPAPKKVAQCCAKVSRVIVGCHD